MVSRIRKRIVCVMVGVILGSLLAMLVRLGDGNVVEPNEAFFSNLVKSFQDERFQKSMAEALQITEEKDCPSCFHSVSLRHRLRLSSMVFIATSCQHLSKALGPACLITLVIACLDLFGDACRTYPHRGASSGPRREKGWPSAVPRCGTLRGWVWQAFSHVWRHA